MTHHAKAPSAGSTQATGSSRSLFRRAFATRGARNGSRGTGAPSPRRTPIALLAALALVMSLAIAAPALAIPPTVGPVTVSEVSYSSVKVSTEVTPNGPVSYAFEVSTDGENWTAKASDFVNGDPQTVSAKLTGLEGGTEYFVRAMASSFFNPPPVFSPKPNPSFTTLVADPPTIPGAVTASPIFSTSATANAEVNRPAKSDDVNCRFEYVDDAEFGANGFANATVRPCTESPIEATGIKAVTAPLGCIHPLTEEPEGKCLKPGTAYHLRLVAENAAPGVVTKDAASTFTTAPPVAKPAVIKANDATDPSYFSAKVSGEVQRPIGADPALDTSCRFEYISDEQFALTGFDGAGQTNCIEAPPEAPLTNTDPTPVTAELSGIKSGTKFHLRLAASNSGGIDTKEAAATFTTPTITPPALVLDPPSDLGYTKVHLAGSVDPEGGTVDPSTSEPFPITWTLQYALASEPGNWQFAEAGTIAGAEAATTAPIPVTKDLQGLAVGTEYKYRLLATYADREAISSEGSFTTEAVATPVASFDPISVLGATAAKFTGSVDANAPGPLTPEGEALFETKWRIECLPECPENPGLSGIVKAGEGSQPISVDVVGLEPNLSYEVKLTATNAAGSTTVERDFTTPQVTPEVKAFPGASDGEGGYIIEGAVNPRNSAVTDCRIEYGPTATYPNAYKANCLPMPTGVDEVQSINHISQCDVARATGGQFKLSYRGQMTNDLPNDATAAEVEAALEALSSIGAGGVAVTGVPTLSYEVTFEGSLAQTNTPSIQPEKGTTPLSYDGSFGCGPVPIGTSVSTKLQGGNNRAKSVEAHVENLSVGAVYHFRIFATNAAGGESSEDGTFTPELATKQPCPANEQLRVENNSLALPECRAYEMVTPAGKEGNSTTLNGFSGNDAVAYRSAAPNIANSGAGDVFTNDYVAIRTTAGWQTIPNLNGSSGSLRDAPSYVESHPEFRAYSSDLRSSLWVFHRKDDPVGLNSYRRGPDGLFTLFGVGDINAGSSGTFAGASDDLSHVFAAPTHFAPSPWGPGAYEFFGTGSDQPDRADVDNSASPITACTHPTNGGLISAITPFHSTDGRVFAFKVFGGCGGDNPPNDEIWARIDGTTSVDVSASQCNRAAADPGGLCNGPVGSGGCSFSKESDGEVGPGCRGALFQGAAADGSRIFFSTTQQRVNSDIDQTNDLYACDIPSGTLAPVGKANHCSSLRLVSGAQTGADVESVRSVSDDGSTAFFVAKGVLADNKDALEEEAVSGDHNLYLWRTDAAHPDGQTTFVARLDSNDLAGQTTPDGRYLVFTTASRLLDTDTDNARDVYRYDADTGELNRASTNVFGVAGNGNAFDAILSGSAVSDDGQKVVFTTAEQLSPADGNGEPDVYLWTPSRVSLISSGSSGSAPRDVRGNAQSPKVAINGSGQDIYFETLGALTPADGDDLGDVYDARIGGGFSFAPPPICTGETCQPPNTPVPPKPNPGSGVPGPGNPTQPKPCPKGKVRNKKGKCVPKHKKHHHKKGHKRHAKSNRGASK